MTLQQLGSQALACQPSSLHLPSPSFSSIPSREQHIVTLHEYELHCLWLHFIEFAPGVCNLANGSLGLEF